MKSLGVLRNSTWNFGGYIEIIILQSFGFLLKSLIFQLVILKSLSKSHDIEIGNYVKIIPNNSNFFATQSKTYKNYIKSTVIQT